MTTRSAAPGPLVPFDRARWLDAFTHDTSAIVDLARRAPSLDVAVPGLTWSVAEVMNHLVVVYRGFAAAVRGEDLSALDGVMNASGTLPERLTRTNADALAMLGFSSAPEEVIAGYLEGVNDFLESFAGVPDPEELRPAPWYGRMSRVATHAVMAESETLVHGQDIARALGGSTKLRAESAAVIAPTVIAEMLPLLVNQATTADLRLRLEFRVRGGPRIEMLIDHGTATAGPVGSGDVDCIISIAAEAAMLIGYGRISVLRALLSGRTIAFGRAPWWGLRFRELFLHT